MSTTLCTPIVSVMRLKPRRSAQRTTTAARPASVGDGEAAGEAGKGAPPAGAPALGGDRRGGPRHADDALGEPRRHIPRQRLVERYLVVHLGGKPPRLELAPRLVQAAQRLHPRQQLLAVDRLVEEIIRAGFDALQPACAVLEPRHEHHRYERGER